MTFLIKKQNKTKKLRKLVVSRHALKTHTKRSPSGLYEKTVTGNWNPYGKYRASVQVTFQVTVRDLIFLFVTFFPHIWFTRWPHLANN